MLKARWLFVIDCMFIIALGACGASPTPIPVQPPLPPAPTASATQNAYPPPVPTLLPGVAYPPPDLTKTARYTPLPTWTPFPPFTPRPTVTPSLTITPSSTPIVPTPIPGFEPEPVQKISPDNFINDSSKLHDLILFETNALFPFSPEKYGSEFQNLVDAPTGLPGEEYNRELWAVSPDGKRMGRISLPLIDSKIFLPQSRTQKPIVVEYGIHLESSGLKTVTLPEECYSYKEFQAENRQFDIFLCRNFKFSPDGRYLSYTFGENYCSRMLSILDLSTGKVIYQNSVNALFPEFVSGDKVFTNKGHCEGGTSLLVDLKTGKEQKAGDYAWDYKWNSLNSAFLVGVHPYQGFITSSFWGYNNLTGQLFAPPQVEYSSQWPSTWVPAGTNILYEQREFIADEKTWLFPRIKGTSQIMRFNLATQKAQTILVDPQYDFWLCVGPHLPCIFKHPDWIQVARTRVPSDPTDLEAYDQAVILCLDKSQCPEGIDLFALNWRTGELLPWDEAPAAPIPTPTGQFKNRGNDFKPLPPDLSSRLVYAHPSGNYAFYVGADGASLWRVVKGGQPVVWVENGENFIYLP